MTDMHGDHGTEFVATMDHYLEILPANPDQAERLLLDKYDGKVVAPEQAIHLVGYRPAVADGLPEGYTLASTSVLKMPCCTCFKAVCKRKDGSTLVLFEHDDEKTAWFGGRPETMATCGDTECCLVDLDSNIAATWREGTRSVTAVGRRIKRKSRRWSIGSKGAECTSEGVEKVGSSCVVSIAGRNSLSQATCSQFPTPESRLETSP